MNGDINEDSLDQSVYQPSAAERAALTAAGYTGFPTSGATAAEYAVPLLALHRAGAAERRAGREVQRPDQPHRSRPAQLRRVRTAHAGSARPAAAATSSRRARPTTAAAWASCRSPSSATSIPTAASPASTRSATASPAATSTASPSTRASTWTGTSTRGASTPPTRCRSRDAWHVTLSGRYNRTSVQQPRPHQARPAAPARSTATTRSVDSTRRRASPSARRARRTLYVGYSEGSRAPTSIELGCADPNQPCKLPNAMAGDPPLDQVVTRTWEAGVRGGQGSRVTWSVGGFRGATTATTFCSSRRLRPASATSRTSARRSGRGFELGVEQPRSARDARRRLHASSTRPTESAETVERHRQQHQRRGGAGRQGARRHDRDPAGRSHPAHPAAHAQGLRRTSQVASRLSLDVDLVAVSSSYARGNENNLHQPDGTYYLGPGTAPGYAVVNLGARYQLNRWLQLFGQVNNVFDRRLRDGRPTRPHRIHERRARSSPGRFRPWAASSPCSRPPSSRRAPRGCSGWERASSSEQGTSDWRLSTVD